MASLNTSTNGPSIKQSYQKIVDTPLPQQASSTYAQWVIYSVQTPLANAFQQDPSKESILKVQTTGDGELSDLVDDFSEGRIQFAYLKLKDQNSALAKSVMIAWCGEGVPERTKGYFTNHMAVVSKILHGYHVQITARSEDDLSPERIVQKVADSSGSRYGGASAASSTSAPAPPVSSKPLTLPTRTGALPNPARPPANVDEDGWGADAPQLTRSRLEKVESAYKPTKVDMAQLTQNSTSSGSGGPDVVRGAYQPVGKVDLAEIRRQAQNGGSVKDDRPTVVKGSYEPVGKVDIAAIRARAQPSVRATSPPRGDDRDPPPAKPVSDKSAAFEQSERLTSLPKPRVANRFGSSFSGTTAHAPVSSIPATTAAPIGVASRTFADEGGKTPAQIWAEKKGRQASTSVSETPASPVQSQPSGGWQSGYAGKKWGAVQTTKTGTSNVSADATGRSDADADVENDRAEAANVGALRDRFAQSTETPPAPDMSSKPSRVADTDYPPPPPSRPLPAEEHVDIPPPPPQPRSPSPEPSTSPVRIAMPVSRTTAAPAPMAAPEPQGISASSISNVIDAHKASDDGDDADEQARAMTATNTVPEPDSSSQGNSGKRALIQFDYEKAEENEIELREGEYVTNIEMVDDDWWLGENSLGERGLFPSNYVELEASTHASASAPESAGVPAAAQSAPSATAQYDYDAAESNELSFPDGAKITNIEFPDEDWWEGDFGGQRGLFPANYVTLDQ